MAATVRSSSEVVTKALKQPATWRDYYCYRENIKWFKQNFTDIKKEHKGKVIIVFDKGIRASDEDMEKIRENLRSLPYRNQAYIRYIPKEKEILLL